MAGDLEDDEGPIELVATVGPLDPVVATLRDVLHRAGALRVVVVLDTEPAAMVDVGRLAPVEVTVGPRVMHLPHAIELDAEPLGLIEARQLPPFEVTAEGEVVGTIGGLDYVADVARGLAALMGGRSVALVQVPTTNAELPLSVTARPGEPVVVSIGEESFDLPGEDAGD